MEARLLKRGETSGRSDDNAETIRKRFRTFVEQSMPVIDHYEALGKAFKISATRTPDEVFADVEAAIDSLSAAAAPKMSLTPAGGAPKPKPAAPAVEEEAVAMPAGTPALAFA